MELERVVALQSSMLPPGPVQRGHQGTKTGRTIDVPALELVLLRIEVLLASGRPRHVLSELEGRSIDTVACAQGCRQHQANSEGRSSADLEKFRQDVGSIRPQVGTKEFL